MRKGGQEERCQQQWGSTSLAEGVGMGQAEEPSDADGQVQEMHCIPPRLILEARQRPVWGIQVELVRQNCRLWKKE